MESKTGEPKDIVLREYSHCLSKLKQELKKRMVINAKTITIVIKIAMEIVEISKKGEEKTVEKM